VRGRGAERAHEVGLSGAWSGPEKKRKHVPPDRPSWASVARNCVPPRAGRSGPQSKGGSRHGKGNMRAPRLVATTAAKKAAQAGGRERAAAAGRGTWVPKGAGQRASRREEGKSRRTASAARWGHPQRENEACARARAEEGGTGPCLCEGRVMTVVGASSRWEGREQEAVQSRGWWRGRGGRLWAGCPRRLRGGTGAPRAPAPLPSFFSGAEAGE
jgi:hypothetical protein